MFLAVLAVATIGMGVAACGSDDDAGPSASTDTTEQAAADGEISIADAWSRQPAEGQTASAVYGVVTNSTDETVTAVSATTSLTDTVELHEVITGDDGEMSMREKEGGYEIAPGGTLVFEPGGAHIMLLDIDPATYPASVDVTLTFDNGTSIDFDAEVRSIDDEAGSMDMGDDVTATTEG